MFNNLVNFQDVVNLFHALRSGRIRNILRRIAAGSSQTIQATWNTTQNPPIQFWDIPQVHARVNRMISGDPHTDYITYVARKYLAARSHLCGLSLGCGTGQKELRWAAECHLEQLDALDIAPARIAAAQRLAQERGITTVHFQVQDIYHIAWPSQHYDLVLSDQSLHHFSPLEPLCANIRRSLKPDGYFVLNEYIGPGRFQWTPRQLEAVNGLLALLPPRYRLRWQDRSLKQRIVRPSRLSMMLADPSEAIESDKIVSTLTRFFGIIERRDYGGALIHPLFAEIAWNFQKDDAETQRLIQLCFDIEDLLLSMGELSSDFSLIVCQPRRETT